MRNKYTAKKNEDTTFYLFKKNTLGLPVLYSQTRLARLYKEHRLKSTSARGSNGVYCSNIPAIHIPGI